VTAFKIQKRIFAKIISSGSLKREQISIQGKDKKKRKRNINRNSKKKQAAVFDGR